MATFGWPYSRAGRGLRAIKDGGARVVAPDLTNTEDRHHASVAGKSASIVSAATSVAAHAQLIGFHCLICGYLRHAEHHQPSPAPMCAGSKARTGKPHEPARMEALVLR
ncbi:hypothetical protein [Geodermatophilus sp. URMC 62]|uniref:hypothetical protein n=1 Tax=Geodermatophilus sp. URMC 62 TaxID=3423414 RepID=UPI00406BF037